MLMTSRATSSTERFVVSTTKSAMSSRTSLLLEFGGPMNQLRQAQSVISAAFTDAPRQDIGGAAETADGDRHRQR